MDRKRNHIKERRDRQEQRLRMEQMAAKMSAKKLQRLQKVRPSYQKCLNELTMFSDKDDQRRSTDRFITYHLTSSPFPDSSCYALPFCTINMYHLLRYRAQAVPQAGRPFLRRDDREESQIPLSGCSSQITPLSANCRASAVSGRLTCALMTLGCVLITT